PLVGSAVTQAMLHIFWLARQPPLPMLRSGRPLPLVPSELQLVRNTPASSPQEAKNKKTDCFFPIVDSFRKLSNEGAEAPLQYSRFSTGNRGRKAMGIRLQVPWLGGCSLEPTKTS